MRDKTKPCGTTQTNGHGSEQESPYTTFCKLCSWKDQSLHNMVSLNPLSARQSRRILCSKVSEFAVRSAEPTLNSHLLPRSQHKSLTKTTVCFSLEQGHQFQLDNQVSWRRTAITYSNTLPQNCKVESGQWLTNIRRDSRDGFFKIRQTTAISGRKN